MKNRVDEFSSNAGCTRESRNLQPYKKSEFYNGIIRNPRMHFVKCPFDSSDGAVNSPIGEPSGGLGGFITNSEDFYSFERGICRVHNTHSSAAR